jgi:hypothetical protein
MTSPSFSPKQGGEAPGAVGEPVAVVSVPSTPVVSTATSSPVREWHHQDMTFTEPAGAVPSGVADIPKRGEVLGQVLGERPQEEQMPGQDIGRRKDGMCSFVFTVALLTVGTVCLGLLVLFPNDGVGPRPAGDDTTDHTPLSCQVTEGHNRTVSGSASVTVSGCWLGAIRAENRSGSGSASVTVRGSSFGTVTTANGVGTGSASVTVHGT